MASPWLVIPLTVVQLVQVLRSDKPWWRKTFLVLVSLVILGFFINQALFIPLDLPAEHSMVGKTVLVTGCTPGGIGYATAKQLAEWNANKIICTVRSDKKGKELGLPPNVEYRVLELGDFASVRQFASELTTKLDVLVLNAGLGTDSSTLTVNGFEEMFQANHLSQFLLTRLLLDGGKFNPNARVVFVSSTAYFFLGKLDREVYGKQPGGRALPFGMGKYTMGTYADTKLMQVLTAKALGERYPKIRFVSTCPGFVATNFMSHMPQDLMGKVMTVLSWYFARTPEQGAARILQLATTRELDAGKFYDAYIPLPDSSELTQTNQDWMYDTSVKLVGL
ncbi:hypothetical protein BASA81_007801 [Batrachochytrium salamandrivorans]|nr:hypothetical protein BASA81_007801 [Batrachochytrium salamandrivorans]